MEDEVRHAGDLGNILVDSEGEAVFSMEIPTNTTLYGRHSIIGRTFVIHGGVDPASGNAGPRMACGIVESETGKITIFEAHFTQIERHKKFHFHASSWQH